MCIEKFLFNQSKCRGEHDTQLYTEANMCKKCASLYTGDGKNFTQKKKKIS